MGSMFDFAHGESLRFVYGVVAVPQLDLVPARHTFRSYSDVLRIPEYGRSAIGVERSILIPS